MKFKSTCFYQTFIVLIKLKAHVFIKLYSFQVAKLQIFQFFDVLNIEAIQMTWVETLMKILFKK